MKTQGTCLAAFLLLFATAFGPLSQPLEAAEQCHFEKAQQLMLQVNNVLSQYSRTAMDERAANGEASPAVQNTVNELAEKSAEVGVRFAKASEAPGLTNTTTIDSSICKDYASLLAAYAPAGKTQGEGQGPSTPRKTPNAIRPRFGHAMPK